MTTYHISKAAIEDASQETALLALLPNCRINAKRRARRCFNMNSILLLVIFYFLVAVPSTYQQCKCKVQFYIKTILKIVRRNHKISSSLGFFMKPISFSSVSLPSRGGIVKPCVFRPRVQTKYHGWFRLLRNRITKRASIHLQNKSRAILASV